MTTLALLLSLPALAVIVAAGTYLLTCPEPVE